MNYLNRPFRAPRAFSPVDAANAFERTGGLAVFGLPLLARRALHIAWLPFALMLALCLALFTPAGLSLGAIATLTTAGAHSAGIIGGTVAFLFASAAFAFVAYRPGDGRVHTPTLTVQQLLLDVVSAFRKQVPAITMFGAQWTARPLKLNEKYTAHIAVYGNASTYDATTGYWNGANTARNGLVDLDVITDTQPTYPLKWLHLDGIKDNKNEYLKVMAGAGYTLGKSCIDTGFFGKMTTRYFSQENVTAVADCDYDWAQDLVSAMNRKGCEPMGRVLFVNTDVAGTLAKDPRMISRDFFGEKVAGQMLSANGYRMWTNCAGFALIQEYPDLPSNNGTALTGVTATAATDVLAKTAHGLVTGDPIVISAIGGGAAGLSTATRYWVIKVDADSFKLATTRALALAGTAINITSDSSGGGLTLALTENLVAFAADGRAFGSLAGIPEGATIMADTLGVVQTLTFDVLTDPESKITMAAAKAQNPNTGDVLWCPTFVYGTNAGRQGSTAVVNNTAAANSALASANADGTALDYAGLRVSSGAS